MGDGVKRWGWTTSLVVDYTLEGRAGIVRTPTTVAAQMACLKQDLPVVLQCSVFAGVGGSYHVKGGFGAFQYDRAAVCYL